MRTLKEGRRKKGGGGSPSMHSSHGSCLPYPSLFMPGTQAMLFSSVLQMKGFVGKKAQVTSDELLDSPSNCLVFTLETKGEFDVHQESLEALFHATLLIFL